MTSKKPILGIDLGTTSCCFAIADGGEARVISNRHGYRLTPSMVALTPNGRMILGNLAKKQAVTNPEGTVWSFKRLLGATFTSPAVVSLQQRVAFPMVPGPSGQVRVQLHGRAFDPAEIASHLLGEVRKSVKQALGKEVFDAIITVPANFNELQRQETVRAAQLAGLNVVRLLHEPTAAALALGVAENERKVIAVYDFGGGTFDITLLIADKNVFEVLASEGILLGGDDCDHVIVRSWLQRLRQETGIDLVQDRMALARLREAAERLRVDLSDLESATIELPFLFDRPSGPFHFTATMHREELERLLGPLVDETIGTCATALRAAGLTTRDVDSVLLIGGMTRMPAIRQAVADFFAQQPVRAHHPEEAVALGAAVLAERLRDGGAGLLMDILPHSLAVSAGGVSRVILQRGTPVPAKRSAAFATTADAQRSVKIRVVQGESNQAESNVLVGVFEVLGLPPRPAGDVTVDVEFSVSSDGLLEVTARTPDRNTPQTVRVSESLRATAVAFKAAAPLVG